MSLFKKKEDPDKWEKKYFSLLDEHDALEKSFQDHDALLCKTITRLSLAVTGFNKELDPYLTRIRKQLKNGLKNEKLQQELEVFSNALMSLEESSDDTADKDPGLLFEFLARHYPHRETEFDRVYQQYQDSNKITLQDLLLELHELMDEEQSVVTEIHPQQAEGDAIRKQIFSLLEESEIPEQFSPQTEQLKIRLQNKEESLSSMLDETFSLLLLIKKHFQSEQRNMAEFLTTLTEQLTELEQKASGASEKSRQCERKRNLLDQSFSEQMQELQNKSVQATELDALKQLVSSRLDNISRQLKKHQQLERQERSDNQQTLQELVEKIKRVETESQELKSKLDAAHIKAIHDPLTGLPNRLAYDDRLAVEVARWERCQAPLSMVIWDIDWFKKINDTYGHKAGDKTLIIIAQLLDKNCRETDFVSRFGGEEFTMLLPDTDAKAAYIIADKLRQTIETTGFNSNGIKIQITISCGISQFDRNDNGETVFKRADEALYKAKKNGRNQCIIA